MPGGDRHADREQDDEKEEGGAEHESGLPS
jgi:hypothetical protein